jgi:hypothetical protein
MRRSSVGRPVVLLAVLLLGSACARQQADATATSRNATVTANLAVIHPTVWVCRPGMIDDNCATNLDATVIGSNGPSGTETFRPATTPAVDCFYLYPTVSQVGLANAPLKATDTEIAVVRAQAARFGADCRVFAPAYEQYSVVSRLQAGGPAQAARDLAYADVRSAWNDYLLNDNGGRPVALIGDDQGSEMLLRLLQDEIEPDQGQRALLVSALLVGADVRVRPGALTGGDLTLIPACTRHDQFGCVVAYSAFQGTAPANALFGVPTAPSRGQDAAAATGRLQALCTNPAALAGGAAPLSPYLPTQTLLPDAQLDDGVLPGLSSANMPAASTGFVSYPNFLSAACEQAGDHAWLAVTPQPAAEGDVRALPTLNTPASWGLHFTEFYLTLGDLVDLVARQSAAYLAANPAGSRN